ncbi:MAG: Hsp20/alpha crystallin family protein [Flavobacteriales bacterium]|nr:Hsp20/alpha crystallin family protein [Flavobacteriales bacterium]
MNTKTTKKSSTSKKELDITQFEITQLLREINPAFRQGVTPLASELNTARTIEQTLPVQQNGNLLYPYQVPQSALTSQQLAYLNTLSQATLSTQPLAYTNVAPQPARAEPLIYANGVQQSNLASQQLVYQNTMPQAVPAKQPLVSVSLESNAILEAQIVSNARLAALISKEAEPKANITENADEFSIELNIAGYKKDEVSYKVSNGILRVSGLRKTESEDPSKYYTVKEFETKTFRRSFILSEDVDSEQIKARIENGILTLEIPKAEPSKVKEKKISEIMLS